MTDLVEALGGRTALDAVVVDFYGRLQDDPTMAAMFAKVDVDKVVAMQQEFLADALDDGGLRSGTTLRAIHEGHGITPAHFSRFIEHFTRTLEDRQVDRDTVAAVGQRLGLYLDDVVGETSESG